MFFSFVKRAGNGKEMKVKSGTMELRYTFQSKGVFLGFPLAGKVSFFAIYLNFQDEWLMYFRDLWLITHTVHSVVFFFSHSAFFLTCTRRE